MLIRASRSHWREDKADEIFAAAAESLEVWAGDGLDFDELADDIAIEIRLQLGLEVLCFDTSAPIADQSSFTG